MAEDINNTLSTVWYDVPLRVVVGEFEKINKLAQTRNIIINKITKIIYVTLIRQKNRGNAKIKK